MKTPERASSHVDSRSAALSVEGTHGKSFPAVAQRAGSEIRYEPLQDFYVKGSPHKVAKGAVATLDPDDPKVGTDTSGTPAIDSAMSALPSISSTWVKGHLINHDLGGIAFDHNLFPLSTAANGEHKREVEYPVKTWLYDGCEVRYSVQASQPSQSSHKGKFDCDAHVTNVKKSSGNKHASKKLKKTIHSSDKADQAYTREYANTTKNVSGKYASVEYHMGNDVYRDEYKDNKVLKSWANEVQNKQFYTDLDKDILSTDPSGTLELLVSRAPNELAPKVKPVAKQLIQSPSNIQKPKENKNMLQKLFSGELLGGKEFLFAILLLVCLLIYAFFPKSQAKEE